MSLVGETDPNFSIPVCNKFKPRILEGQLCYYLDINEFKNKVDDKKLMSHGLVMMLDYNEDRMGLDTSIENKESKDWKDLGDMDEAGEKKNEAMIYFETQGT